MWRRELWMHTGIWVQLKCNYRAACGEQTPIWLRSWLTNPGLKCIPPLSFTRGGLCLWKQIIKTRKTIPLGPFGRLRPPTKMENKKNTDEQIKAYFFMRFYFCPFSFSNCGEGDKGDEVMAADTTKPKRQNQKLCLKRFSGASPGEMLYLH